MMMGPLFAKLSGRGFALLLSDFEHRGKGLVSILSQMGQVHMLHRHGGGRYDSRTGGRCCLRLQTQTDRSRTGFMASTHHCRSYSPRERAFSRNVFQSSTVPSNVISGIPQMKTHLYTKYCLKQFIITTCAAALSTGPVVEKVGVSRSWVLSPTCFRICSEKLSNTSGQGLRGEPFTKSCRSTVNVFFPSCSTNKSRSFSAFSLTCCARPCAMHSQMMSGVSTSG